MFDWGSDPRAPEQIPEVLGRYEILLPIASGGVATVYLASSTGAVGFERDVAIKLTHRHLRDSPEFFTQLVDEARLAGRSTTRTWSVCTTWASQIAARSSSWTTSRASRSR